MGNNTIAMDSPAKFSLDSAMFDATRTVTTDLEVRERAVTQRASWGPVCPFTGGTGFAARYGTDFGAFSAMSNVQLSKPRTGYDATSGTG